MNVAMIGAGCFWCAEAVFDPVPGVRAAVPGYAGGAAEHATYRQVSRGDTGHAEVVRIEFDPGRVGYRDLIDRFWRMHDPTSLDRQGADAGSQYRSVIFVFDEEQRRIAEASRDEAQKRFPRPIVTRILPAPPFTPAEPEHRGYYRRNPDAAYCRAVIRPKLDALEAGR